MFYIDIYIVYIVTVQYYMGRIIVMSYIFLDDPDFNISTLLSS